MRSLRVPVRKDVHARIPCGHKVRISQSDAVKRISPPRLQKMNLNVVHPLQSTHNQTNSLLIFLAVVTSTRFSPLRTTFTTAMPLYIHHFLFLRLLRGYRCVLPLGNSCSSFTIPSHTYISFIPRRTTEKHPRGLQQEVTQADAVVELREGELHLAMCYGCVFAYQRLHRKEKTSSKDVADVSRC